MNQQLITAHNPLDQIRRRRVTDARPDAPGLTPVQQAQLQRVLAAPMDYVDDPAFTKRNAEKLLFDQAPELPEPNTSWYHPVMEDLSSNRSSSKVVNVVLKADQERALFLQFNYARYRVAKLQKRLGQRTLTPEQAHHVLHWYNASEQYRDKIAQFNLALVLAMAKRVRSSDLDFADLISEGNMALLRAIDKFNVSRGFKFSTYACRAILKAFSRIGVKQTRYRNLFPTDFDPALEKSDHQRTQYDDHEQSCADEVRRIVRTNAAELTDVEQQIIHHRFAIDRNEETAPLTLEQVGKLVGLTKERVRQIQNKALAKIRTTLEESYLDGPHAAAAQTEEE